jgi:hypothetical protein
MPYKITKADYSKILDYYGLTGPKSAEDIKTTAEKILAKKLCSCIKKVDPSANAEPRTIGICTKAVINRKGLTRGKFKCKNGRKIELKKTARKLTVPKTKNKTKTQKKALGVV